MQKQNQFQQNVDKISAFMYSVTLNLFSYGKIQDGCHLTQQKYTCIP